MKKVHPVDGGCWCCHTAEGGMLFSTEFDTFIHENCLREALKNEDDPEARIMAKELL